jgi:hypothetical protein
LDRDAVGEPGLAEVALAERADRAGVLVFFAAFLATRFTAGFRLLAFAVLRAEAALRLPGREGLLAFFRLDLPCGVLDPAVFRRQPPVRAAARAPAPALRFDGVDFCPRDLPLDPDFLVLFFFAILMPLKMVSGFDRWPLTVVSSIAYRNHKRRKYSPPELKYRQKHDRGGLGFAWQQTIRSRTIHKEVARPEPLRDPNAPGRSRLRR